MSVQTTYYSAPEIGYPGQLVNIFNEAPVVEGFWSEGGVYPGRAVVKGTLTTATANKWNDRKIPFGVLHPTLDTDVIVGIPVLVARLPTNTTNNLAWYPDEWVVSVLKRGAMYAIAGEAVVSRDPVYAVYSVGDSGLAIGDLIKDAVAGTTGAAILVPNAYWDTAAAAGGVAIVKMAMDPEV